MCISISGVYVCFGFLGLLVGLIFMVSVKNEVVVVIIVLFRSIWRM